MEKKLGNHCNVEELGAMGGYSSAVRALVAQASELGSIPSGFPDS